MSNPPPIPPEAEKQKDDAFESYQTIAETVGGIPSIRKKDNLYQGLAILGTTLVGVVIGLFSDSKHLALPFGLLGAIVGLLVSGIVLMVLGWIRAARK